MCYIGAYQWESGNSYIKNVRRSQNNRGIATNKTRLVLGLILLAYLLFPQFVLANCSNAYSCADDAYSYAKKVYHSEKLHDVHDYAGKTMSAAEDAMSEAKECGCDDAYSSAKDAYSYARKAYQSDYLYEALYYMRKAMSAADDAMYAAADCGI
jgi:hypothetical protein